MALLLEHIYAAYVGGFHCHLAIKVKSKYVDHLQQPQRNIKVFSFKNVCTFLLMKGGTRLPY